MPVLVCNASPLITLAKAGLLDLLPRLFDEVCVPAAVMAEIARGPVDDPMRNRLASTAWLRPVRLDAPLSPLAVWQLGAGEAEVIEFARLHPNHGVALDDRAARRAAHGLGLTVYGTLSLLALARRRGLLPSFRQAADAVVRAGLYVQSSLVEAIAVELGE
jgi:predicted nucleic acid-binding protein